MKFKKRFIPCKDCFLCKSLTSDFRLLDFPFYLGVLCPKYFRPRFYYVFVNEDKVRKLFHYSFVFTTKWVEVQSLRQCQVEPCRLVAFYSFDSIGILV